MTDVFNGKIAIVTGGTSGIGYAVSEELLKRGATVWVIGSRKESVEKAKVSLAAYTKAKFAAADVTVAEDVKRVIDTCVKEDTRIDYLFNNAGILKANPIEESTLDDWKEIVDINLWGVIHGVHYALPVMLAQKGGHIVNTSSGDGLFGMPYVAMYVTTKFAIVGLTESLYYEYEPRNIAFTVFCPGNVATPIFKGVVDTPKDVIPVEEAVRALLDGVEKKERLVVVPESIKTLVEEMNRNPAYKDQVLRDIVKNSQQS
jgi:NAD(P)-dependent dehydrogenase (short-subunit alcohol dehydrogenase family)